MSRQRSISWATEQLAVATSVCTFSVSSLSSSWSSSLSAATTRSEASGHSVGIFSMRSWLPTRRSMISRRSRGGTLSEEKLGLPTASRTSGGIRAWASSMLSRLNWASSPALSSAAKRHSRAILRSVTSRWTSSTSSRASSSRSVPARKKSSCFPVGAVPARSRSIQCISRWGSRNSVNHFADSADCDSLRSLAGSWRSI
mmetsp:Transcript_27880/g.73153  ORF Transcript_27880/g.73153 Transcript_27880/m.73153 type:complete len:200 (-) Transcript_27880:1227-1826(-)